MPLSGGGSSSPDMCACSHRQKTHNMISGFSIQTLWGRVSLPHHVINIDNKRVQLKYEDRKVTMKVYQYTEYCFKEEFSNKTFA